MKADDRTRTDNLLITNQLLCQLSHIGKYIKEGPTKWEDSLRPTCTSVHYPLLTKCVLPVTEPKRSEDEVRMA